MNKPSALAAIALAASLLLATLGCSGPAKGQPVREPLKPAPPDLSTPETSVRSYLEWTTYAYRLADSEVAMAAMDPYWSVHVDSYIERMRQEGDRGIDQSLVRFQTRSQSVEGTAALVAASEDWTYRYFSLQDQVYVTPEYKISYETTYTLALEPTGWLVTDVQARPLGELK